MKEHRDAKKKKKKETSNSIVVILLFLQIINKSVIKKLRNIFNYVLECILYFSLRFIGNVTCILV